MPKAPVMTRTGSMKPAPKAKRDGRFVCQDIRPQFAHQLAEQVHLPEDLGVNSGSFSGLIAKISGSIQRGLIAHHTLDKLG